MCIRDRFQSVSNVFTDGSGEEKGILRDYGNLLPVFRHIEIHQIDAVNEDLSVRGRNKADEKIQDRGFSGSGFSGKSDTLTRSDLQIEVLQDIPCLLYTSRCV